MDIPSFLLNKTQRERFLQAIEIIPHVVAQMAEYEGIRVRPILLTVYGYTPNGLILSIDHFWLEKKDLRAQLDQAEAQGCDVDLQGHTITVRRNLPDGKYYIAKYEPAAQSE